MDWRALAAKYDIPYRGLPDIDATAQFGLDDVPLLIEYLRSDYYLDRELAAQQLANLAVRCLDDIAVDDRRAVTQLEPTVEVLQSLLSDPSPRVQQAAARALSELQPYFPDQVEDMDIAMDE